MTKFLLSGFVVVSFIGYSINQKLSNQNGVLLSPVASTLPVTPSFLPSLSSASPVPKSNATGFKDGQFTGAVADAFYGNIQVAAVISGGKITDVQFLQYPSDRRTSVEINSQALPLLRQETIQAQSASVNGITGATQTSRAYVESLQSALNQAKI